MSDTSPILDVDLSKEGGGFLCLEVVPKASLGMLSKSGNRCIQAHLEVKLKCQPTNLPKGEVRCFAQWKLPGSEPFEGSMATLNVDQKVVTPWLELTSDGARKAGIGRILEAGGDILLMVKPDVPYTDTSPITLAKGELPELSLTLSWLGEGGKKLSALPDQPALRIGDDVTLYLKRTSWRCHARLRVTSSLDDKSRAETLFDFGESSESASWRVGYDNGVLQLPTINDKGKLIFTIQLQVSDDDGENYATLITKNIAIARPTLTAFAVEMGEGIKKALQSQASGYLDFYDTSSLDHGIRVKGSIANIAAKADLPFAVELWAYSPGNSGAIYPMLSLFDHRATLGRLSNGAFDIYLGYAWTLRSLDSLRGVSLFAIMRAAAGDPLRPMPTALQHSMRLFGDEDFSQKAPGLGICSQDVTAEMKATREPLLMTAWQEINAASELVLACGVCGPESFWKGAGAKFALAARGPGGENPTALEKNVTYAPAAGSSRGVISARFAFSELDAIAGYDVTAKLTTKNAVNTVSNGGIVRFAAKPVIGPLKWLKDEVNGKPRLHFVCRTEFYPHDKQNRTLDVTLQTLMASGPYAAWKDETSILSYPGQSKKPTVDVEGKVEAFITNPTDLGRIEQQLVAGTVKTKVTRPAGAEKLTFGKVSLDVKPWEGCPGQANK